MPGRGLRFKLLLILLAVGVILAVPAAVAAQDALIKARTEYTEETDLVDKAKKLAKLGSREMNEIRRLLNLGDNEESLAVLQQYRDWVRSTTQQLVSGQIDAVRHSGGFKELQISLRTFIRRLDDLMFTLQQDVRGSFRAVRSDLEADESVLIDALFPPRTPRQPASANAR